MTQTPEIIAALSAAERVETLEGALHDLLAIGPDHEDRCSIGPIYNCTCDLHPARRRAAAILAKQEQK